MVQHLTGAADKAAPTVECDADPIGSLVTMFVDMVQKGRAAAGQCPVLRPVFLKPHGVARAQFVVRDDLPASLSVGPFVAGARYDAWTRFASDTLPTLTDWKTTTGIGIKLFGVPGEKLFGPAGETTVDFTMQNFDVFFVDTAKDMCAFTQAGVINHNYDPYLAAHPKTKEILDEMAKPVPSALTIDYWSVLPYAYGAGQFCKFKLEPTAEAYPLPSQPNDPDYLAVDFASRLAKGEVRFKFCVQLRTNPDSEPLDQATVRWDESISPAIHIADVILPQQDVTVRGQATYGENLSFNMWRVPPELEPQGSIAAARKVVYAASASYRRNINGVPDGEPATPRPDAGNPPCIDSTIVRARIHPGIGIARMGDAKTAFYIGPEVEQPLPLPPGAYRDESGALKRQAARFRIYGYNAAGQVVAELTPQSADIEWTVHVANRKAEWYQFQAALDIPEAASMTVPLRNPDVKGADRAELAIDAGPVSIAGVNTSGPAYAFDKGKFKTTPVSLGEAQTDDSGRLLVLGGLGVSASPSGAPVYNPDVPTSFNNADDWYDDIADGPVDASVRINGQSIPCEGAWVVVAPPNYGPDIIGWRTMGDMLLDVYTEAGWIGMPETVSFTKDIYPVLQRLTNLQWVNAGFAAMFGAGGPFNFENPALIAKLATAGADGEAYHELRRTIFNCFRPHPPGDANTRPWPWLYGDAYGSFSDTAPNNNLGLSNVRQAILQRWVKGDFVNDWDPAATVPHTLAAVPLAEQPGMLDRAAVHFCLADAFHPGCELTWPMRHATLYTAPYRIRRAAKVTSDYGPNLNQTIALSAGGPLSGQGPGTLSRWMALPWQGDTAFCRSGYDPSYDPYLPSFWVARVPNQVLTAEDYAIVMDETRPRAERIAAFNHRPNWLRNIMLAPAPEVMMRMIADFGGMGIVEQRPGPANDPDFPPVIFVETLGPPFTEMAAAAAALLKATPSTSLTAAQRAGFVDEAHLAEFRRVRFQGRS
ncbi:MAG: catalase [Alphaproteobacteria bacterium]|nr:MAG: catalase [Alphaproteobacteria bacterium]